MFRSINLADRAWFNKTLEPCGELGCDYCFGTLFSWQYYYKIKIAKVAGCVASFIDNEDYTGYLCPSGGDFPAAVKELLKDAQERGIPFQMGGISEKHKAELEEAFPGKFAFGVDRDSAEYIYDINDLAELKGKKYHGKKNHVNHFMKEFSDWKTELIDESNIDECRSMDQAWLSENTGFGGELSLSGEDKAMRACFQNYRELELEGLLLRVNGRVCAFTIAEIMPGGICADVRFEKAFTDTEGSYSVINMLFAQYLREKYPGLKYLNREEDMGLDGLRQAKESYKPIMMADKYTAVLKENI